MILFIGVRDNLLNFIIIFVDFNCSFVIINYIKSNGSTEIIEEVFKMKFIKIRLSDNEYEMLKKYAKARRKYEIGNGFTIHSAIEQMVAIGLSAIEETQIVDKNHKPIDWKS